jgi:hypothetical protein
MSSSIESSSTVNVTDCDTADLIDAAVNLGATTAGLGATTAGLGATTAVLGATTADLGATTADLGATTADLGATTADLGALTANLVTSTADSATVGRDSVKVYSDLIDELKLVGEGSLSVDDILERFKDDPDFLDKLRNISDMINANYSEEGVSVDFNPPGYEDRKPEYVVLEVKNLRNEYAKKFYAHSVISFLFAVLSQDKELTPETRPIVESFLKRAWGYDANKHLRSAYRTIKATEKDRMSAASATFSREVTAVMAPALEQIQSLDRFITNNYEQLRLWTSTLYGETPDLEDSIIVYDTFASRELGEAFMEKHQESFVGAPILIQARQRVAYAPFSFNRERVIISKEDPMIAALFEEQQNTKILAKDILQNKASKLNQVPVEDLKALSKMRDNIEGFSGTPYQDEARQKKIREYHEAREQVEMKMAPDGTVAVPILSVDETGKLARKVIYTKTESAKETSTRFKETFTKEPTPITPKEDRDLVNSILL